MLIDSFVRVANPDNRNYGDIGKVHSTADGGVYVITTYNQMIWAPERDLHKSTAKAFAKQRKTRKN